MHGLFRHQFPKSFRCLLKIRLSECYFYTVSDNVTLLKTGSSADGDSSEHRRVSAKRGPHRYRTGLDNSPPRASSVPILVDSCSGSKKKVSFFENLEYFRFFKKNRNILDFQKKHTENEENRDFFH